MTASSIPAIIPVRSAMTLGNAVMARIMYQPAMWTIRLRREAPAEPISPPPNQRGGRLPKMPPHNGSTANIKANSQSD